MKHSLLISQFMISSMSFKAFLNRNLGNAMDWRSSAVACGPLDTDILVASYRTLFRSQYKTLADAVDNRQRFFIILLTTSCSLVERMGCEHDRLSATTRQIAYEIQLRCRTVRHQWLVGFQSVWLDRNA